MIKVYSIPQQLLEASKLISQINEWGMRCQRNANKASKQQIAIRFTGDRESEKYYLICVSYTSLPVMAKSILLTDCTAVYMSRRSKKNLTFESFEWLSQSSKMCRNPGSAHSQRIRVICSVGEWGGAKRLICSFIAQLDSWEGKWSWFKTSAVACLAGLLAPATPHISKNTARISLA